MFIANDDNGNRIDIRDAVLNRKYYCPLCGQELNQRRGEKNSPHFAHKKNNYSKCDTWHYDMSEWHRDWQLQFPEECREVVIERNGKKHRADILIGNNVVEFQHSRISNKEFKERNSFYISAGFNVIWLFDMTEDILSHRITRYPFPEYHFDWKYHWKTFDDFDPACDKKVYICFQLSKNVADGYCGIEHVSWMSDDKKSFETENTMSYDRIEFIEFSKIYKTARIERCFDYKSEGKTIPQILFGSNSEVVGLINLKTGKRVKVGNHLPSVVKKVYGYLGKSGGYGYYDDRREIYYWYKPEWALEWTC